MWAWKSVAKSLIASYEMEERDLLNVVAAFV